MTERDIPAETSVHTALVPGPRGGMLRRGGLPNNRGGGRLPSSLFHWARLKQEKARKALLEVIADKKHPGRVRASIALLELAQQAEQRTAQEVNSEGAAVLMDAFLGSVESCCSPEVANRVLDAFLSTLERQGLLPQAVEWIRYLDQHRGEKLPPYDKEER